MGQGWDPGLEEVRGGLLRSCRRGWEVAGLGDTRTWSPRALPGQGLLPPVLLPGCPQPWTGVPGGSGSGDTAPPARPLGQEGLGWDAMGWDSTGWAVPCCANLCHPCQYSAIPCRAVPCPTVRRGPALTPIPAGTTWMQEILTLLFSLGDARPAKTIPNWERAPWLEQIYCREALRDTGTPRLLTTHLPARVLAPALQRSKAKVSKDSGRGVPSALGGPCRDIPHPQGFPQSGKRRGLSERGAANPLGCGDDTGDTPQVIYVARNPKDVAVSFYHFHHLAKFLPDPSSFDAFLTQFLEGTGKGWGVSGRGTQPQGPPSPPAFPQCTTAPGLSTSRAGWASGTSWTSSMSPTRSCTR